MEKGADLMQLKSLWYFALFYFISLYEEREKKDKSTFVIMESADVAL
jgi:hypothetical protein